ncbi:potassium/sodium hyperpolarization-activated cyclic nucleotide-gated channel 2-like [Orbicella faveolata]|uniref:potassium/sodium hyperpolarization-activated cyclic nucleotide-gated channel 2-like n=1 Tax=Orbicella faveolata TaxID=48498 RepID=UPI0009E533BD|nr:potassium/sodium hyperpolarization-activated cyclic nucleotide-gated channel 2-like [Orbicella faveolata]
MSEVRSDDAEGTLRSASCKSIDKLQTDSECKETRDAKHDEISSAPENQSEDTSANGKRASGSSYETENSILSSHLSLQALQALNDASAQDDDEVRGTEEIGLCEQGSSNEISVEGNPVAFREFDSTCSSPLLNGRVVNNEDAHITTENLQETISERNNHLTNRASRIFSFLGRKLRTSSSNAKRTNGDVIVTIDAEELTVLDPQAKPKPSFNDRVKVWFQPMDNKMNMKVFGSRKAMADELVRFRKAGWIIHPTSAFRLYWDLMILSLLIVNMFVLPVAIAFFNDDMSPSWIAFNSISDGAFLLDIVLNFRTGVLVHGTPNKFILDPKKIAIRYARTWFLIDLVSSFPFDYMVSSATSSGSGRLLGASRALRILRMAKLLSLLRLLRISRLVRYVHQYEEILNVTRSVIRFVNLISLMMLVAHWNGCMQYLVPVLDDFPDDSWVMIHGLRDKAWTEQYLWALFKALSHMLCIGYGRHPPQNIPETCVTISSMMTGATFYALFIAYSINVIQTMDSPGRNYREKIQQIEEYMSHRKLPVNLRDKITKYYEHRFQGKLFDEEKILGEVSRPLRKAIVNYNCRELLRAVPFFYDADPDFVSAIITKLEFEVYLEGDVIIREGELGTEMYFLKSGIVSVSCDGVTTDDLTDGSYFGEICLLTNARRTASITAKTLCDIFILHAEDFREVVDEYPEMRQVMESVASQRLSRMGKSVDFSSCPSKELLLARLQSSRASSICGSCSNLLQPREYNPEIVITRDFKTDCDMSDNEVT